MRLLEVLLPEKPQLPGAGKALALGLHQLGVLALSSRVDRFVHVLDQVEGVVDDLAAPAREIAFKGAEEGRRHVHAGRLYPCDLFAGKTFKEAVKGLFALSVSNVMDTGFPFFVQPRDASNVLVPSAIALLVYANALQGNALVAPFKPMTGGALSTAF